MTKWPNNKFSGSYVEVSYGNDKNFDDPYALACNTNRVVNNTDGSIVGYKYFNLNESKGKNNLKLSLNLIPAGIDGTIQLMLDRPWTSQKGKLLGSFELKADMPQEATEAVFDLPELAKLSGKHAIYFVFKSNTKQKSLCTLLDFAFQYSE